MADEALAPDKGNEDDSSVVEPLEPSQEVQDAPDGEGGEKPEKSSEFEIVRQGKDGSQPDKIDKDAVNALVSKRVNRLNAKVHDTEKVASQAQTDLRLKEEENKLLKESQKSTSAEK